MGQAPKGLKLKMVLLDCFMSFIWTLVTPCMGVMTFMIAEYMDYKGDRTPIMYTVILVVSLLFGEAAFNLGGPAWNPTGPLLFYLVGAGDDTLLTVLVRVPAMAIGAAGGILLGTTMMPSNYRPLMGSGPQLKTDVYTGALTEGLLTFAINLVVLYVVLRATSNRFLQTLLILTIALILVRQGTNYTGPALNPSDAFAWACLNKTSATREHVLVYWLPPFVGTMASALVYRRLFGPPGDAVPAAEKEKTKTA